MSDIILFEDIYEPIQFQVKNIKGETFDIETQFRTIEMNIEIEKLSGLKHDKDGKIIDLGITENEKICKLMTLMCGKNDKFWSQFQPETVKAIMEKLYEKEKEKYKKKLEKK